MGVDANPCYLTLLKYVVEFLFSIDRIETVLNEVGTQLRTRLQNPEKNNIINQCNYMRCKFLPRC